MTEEQLNIITRLSCQRALLGVVTPSLRMVTIGWDHLKSFEIKAYFDSPPSNEQIEDMEAVCAEVESDIPFEKDKVQCIYSIEPLKDLGVLKHIVYSRKE